MRSPIKHMAMLCCVGLLFGFSVNAAPTPEPKSRVVKEPPALRACFESCKPNKDEVVYEKCMNRCIDAHPTSSTPGATGR